MLESRFTEVLFSIAITLQIIIPLYVTTYTFLFLRDNIIVQMHNKKGIKIICTANENDFKCIDN